MAAAEMRLAAAAVIFASTVTACWLMEQANREGVIRPPPKLGSQTRCCGLFPCHHVAFSFDVLDFLQEPGMEVGSCSGSKKYEITLRKWYLSLSSLLPRGCINKGADEYLALGSYSSYSDYRPQSIDRPGPHPFRLVANVCRLVENTGSPRGCRMTCDVESRDRIPPAEK